MSCIATQVGSTENELVRVSSLTLLGGCKFAWAIHGVLHYKVRQFRSLLTPHRFQQFTHAQ